MTAYKESDLSSLYNIQETIAVYTNIKLVYDKIKNTRRKHDTFLLYDQLERNPYQVISTYKDKFYQDGITDLEVYHLPQRCAYVPYVTVLIVLLVLVILLVSYMLYKRNKIDDSIKKYSYKY